MDDLRSILYLFFIVGGLAYIIYFRPQFEKDRDTLIFDNRVLSFIDGLYFSELDELLNKKPYCSFTINLRPYVERQLSEAHKLPSNQCLIEYTATDGYLYCSFPSNGHALFALLCIAQFAKDRDNTELVEWCESKLNRASHYSF